MKKYFKMVLTPKFRIEKVVNTSGITHFYIQKFHWYGWRYEY